jgi:ABC-type multidrug transport system fused ATPase/permease subunit
MNSCRRPAQKHVGDNQPPSAASEPLSRRCRLIDVALPKRDVRRVLLGTLVFCGVYLASLGINYLGSFVSCLLTQKMVLRIRVSLLRQIHTLPTHRHEKSQVGDTLYRIEQNVDRVAELSGDILPTKQRARPGASAEGQSIASSGLNSSHHQIKPNRSRGCRSPLC